jgi:hypothetical protein
MTNEIGSSYAINLRDAPKEYDATCTSACDFRRGKRSHPSIPIVANVEISNTLNNQPHFGVFMQMLFVKKGFLGLKIRSCLSVEAHRILLVEPARYEYELLGADGVEGWMQDDVRTFADCKTSQVPSLVGC